MRIHSKDAHKNKELPAPIKTRPKRVAARRANELMCLIFEESTQAEDVEWLNEEDVTVEDIIVDHENDKPAQKTVSSKIPIVGESLSSWLESPWTAE